MSSISKFVAVLFEHNSYSQYNICNKKSNFDKKQENLKQNEINNKCKIDETNNKCKIDETNNKCKIDEINK